MRVALVGQPNSGKSTVFNAVAGYRSLTSNFAGTTVEYTRGRARINGAVLDLIDLPGLYSLLPSAPVEASGVEFLLAHEWDVIVNVVDASQLARSLELTLELKDLEAPLVVCLNMMDEAARKGMVIDSRALAAALGVPVVEAIAARGQGIPQTFRAALTLHHQAASADFRPFLYASETEQTVQRLALALAGPAPTTQDRREASGFTTAPEPAAVSPCAEKGCWCPATCCEVRDSWVESVPASAFPPARFLALQAAGGDPGRLPLLAPQHRALVDSAQREIGRLLGQPGDTALSSARHAACLDLFERVARVTKPRADWREHLDRVAMHPVWGYAVLVGVFLGFFQLIFEVGKFGEARILSIFDALIAALAAHLNPMGVLFAALKGGLLGVAGAVAIVLPYLLPFLIGLAILEDAGYLARVGYLMDALMHRLGLHGAATLPVLLGYGCSVPAVMAARILPSRRDRFIAAFLAVLVPCSARMTVIMGLVGFYLGAYYALGIYALNLLVVMLAGHLLSRLWPEVSPGMMMEVPSYRMPAPRVVLHKTWWRLREFVIVAFPLLVAGSAVLSLVEFYGWERPINLALSPLTALLGLPHSVGLTLIFGVLRKELSLLMLMQALGTTHVLSVMTAAQIVIFSLFVTFYLPCLATLAAMLRELGWRLTAAAGAGLLSLAVLISLAARGVLLLH